MVFCGPRSTAGPFGFQTGSLGALKRPLVKITSSISTRRTVVLAKGALDDTDVNRPTSRDQERASTSAPSPKAAPKRVRVAYQDAGKICSEIRKHLDRGQVSRAVDKANEAIASYPDSAYVLMHAGMALAQAGKVAEARTHHQRSASLAPTNPKFSHAWALFEGRNGNVKRARELFQRTAELENPPSLKTLHAWADLEARSGDPVRARALFRQALAAGTDEATAASGGISQVYTTWALFEARSEGRPLEDEDEGPSASAAAARRKRPGGRAGPDAPAELFEKATQSDELNARAWVSWGTYEWASGHQTKARSIFRRGLKALGGAHHVLLSTWAAHEARVARVESARALYRKAQAADPDNIPTLLKWAQLEARNGHYDKAQSLFDTALQRDPRNRHLQHALAQLELNMGRRDDAVERLRTLIRGGLDSDGLALHTLGTVLLQDGLIAEARRCFQEGSRSARLVSARRLHVESLAELESYQGSRELAKVIYEDGLKSLGPSARFLRMYALLEKKLKNLEAAAKLLEESCRLDPNDVRSWMNLAIVQRRRGKVHEARTAVKQALTVTPDNPDLYIALAQIELQGGFVQRARDAYADGMQECPLNRCGALITCFAVFESGERNYDRARELFRKGAEGNPTHAPLFDAWAQLETMQGNASGAAVLQERVQQLATMTRPRSSGRPGGSV